MKPNLRKMIDSYGKKNISNGFVGSISFETQFNSIIRYSEEIHT